MNEVITIGRAENGTLYTSVPLYVSYHSPTRWVVGYPISGASNFALNIVEHVLRITGYRGLLTMPMVNNHRVFDRAFDVYHDFEQQWLVPLPDHGPFKVQWPVSAIHEWIEAQPHQPSEHHFVPGDVVEAICTIVELDDAQEIPVGSAGVIDADTNHYMIAVLFEGHAHAVVVYPHEIALKGHQNAHSMARMEIQPSARLNALMGTLEGLCVGFDWLLSAEGIEGARCLLRFPGQQDYEEFALAEHLRSWQDLLQSTLRQYGEQSDAS